MAKVRPTTCPYCGSPAIFDSIKEVIICEPCDAEYKITSQGGAKVKKIGVLDDHEDRISALEKTETAPTPENGQGPEDIEDPEGVADNDNGKEIFPE